MINLVALQRNLKFSRTSRASTTLRLVYNFSAIVTLLLPVRWYLSTRNGLEDYPSIRKACASCLHCNSVWLLQTLLWFIISTSISPLDQSAVPFHALVSRSQPLYSHTVVLQLLSLVLLFVTSWTAACQVSLSFTISWSLLKLMSIESVMPSNQLILCCPLLLRPSIFPSIRVFSNESALHIRWSKDWSFSFSLSPSHENSGLISFRIDWFDLLAVQGMLNHLLLQPSITTIF